MKTSRERVLDYIQAHRAVTIAELCQALGGAEANMRHHLSILQQQGLVRVIGTRQAAGQPKSTGKPAHAGGKTSLRRGRPARIFGPVEPSPAGHLESLVSALLDEILPALPPEATEQFLDRVAQRMAGELLGEAAGAPHLARRSGNLTARLFAAVECLNRAHYQARWEARPDAPLLILSRCPFGDLPGRRPEICRLDAHLLALLTGAAVEQTRRLEKDARGLTSCVFRISKPSL